MQPTLIEMERKIIAEMVDNRNIIPAVAIKLGEGECFSSVFYKSIYRKIVAQYMAGKKIKIGYRHESHDSNALHLCKALLKESQIVRIFDTARNPASFGIVNRD